MSNPSAHLNRQFGVISAFIYNELLDATKYAYRGYRTERAKHFEYKTVSPVVSTVTLGAGTKVLSPPREGPTAGFATTFPWCW